MAANMITPSSNTYFLGGETSRQALQLSFLRLAVCLSFLLVVRVEGLEPPRREALDPKSSVSTNFTTPAGR